MVTKQKQNKINKSITVTVTVINIKIISSNLKTIRCNSVHKQVEKYKFTISQS